MSDQQLPFSPASERNKEPIRAVLAEEFPASGCVLEIGAGTGQHAVYLAAALSGLQWQPTDRSVMLAGLQRRLDHEGAQNILPPLALDVLKDPWPSGPFAAAFSANTAHIMSWQAVCAMLAGVAESLLPGAPFALYGPFHFAGEHTAQSNADFHRQLRARDPNMGIRDALQVEAQATISGLVLARDIEMPANNRILLFRREAS